MPLNPAARRWLTWLALLCAAAAQAAESLPRAADLGREARAAAERGEPLVILFSRADCRYCEIVRRDYLLPLHAASQRGTGPLVRQVDQGSPTPLTDFDGRRSDHGTFANRQRIRLVPVVAFFDAHGQALTEPLVGLRLRDFYGSYLETALAQARQRLRENAGADAAPDAPLNRDASPPRSPSR